MAAWKKGLNLQYMGERRLIRLKEDWENISEETVEKLLNAVAKHNCYEKDWYDGKRILDSVFANYYVERYKMIYVRGQFFNVNGICNQEEIARDIYETIEEYVPDGIAKKVSAIVEAIKIKAYKKEIVPHKDRIHFQNGTYYLDGRFYKDKQICINRLAVNYMPDTGPPSQWIDFLNQLLEPPDIITLQEYMGYCLIPTTVGQKMLFIVGSGGEGKSRIGRVMRALLGDNMNTGSIQKVETDRFARADLEWKLLLLDDDMKMEALPQTNYIKSIVTLEDKIDLERKGKQSEQGILFSRFLCFGNGNLSALFDRSNGFFRRQIILETKPKPEDRVDDPYLGQKLIDEKESILLWCLEGLNRLINNDYHFTISQKATDKLQATIEEANNVYSFMKSEGYIRVEENTHASSKQLHTAYCVWCKDNLEKALSEKSFITELKKYAKNRGIPIEHKNDIPIEGGKKVRGFHGIHVQIDTKYIS